MAWAVPGGKLNSVGTLAKYDGPLLQSHGDADRTIPFDQGKRLHEAAQTRPHVSYDPTAERQVAYADRSTKSPRPHREEDDGGVSTGGWIVRLG